jgi:lipopolysaccharide transport system ATP-binding protein
MGKPIIEVEHLGKCYRIGAMREPYLSLREELAKKTRRVSSAFSRAFRKGQIGSSDSETDFWALKDVSFSVQEGEAVGIIGRNGAGKSTLLKILSQITPPTKGRITMRGRVASLLEVGTGFHPELTGRENIFLNGAILGMRREEIRRKFDEIVAFAEVDQFLDTPVKRYSSGMYVRLAFAVAAHLEPEILVVDEVLAVGDAEFQKKCLGKMGNVAKEGRTILFVSHNMGAVRRLCPKVLLLERGQVKEAGDSAAICEAYLFSGQSMESGRHLFKDEKKHLIEFLNAETVNTKGETTGIFRADEPIRFRITYRVNENVSGVTLGLNICTSDSASLWATSDFDVFMELIEQRAAGVWKYDCVAPENVLKPGRYLVALGAGNLNGQFYHHPDLFPFEVTTEGYWRESHKYFGVGGGGPVAVPMIVERPVPVEHNDEG